MRPEGGEGHFLPGPRRAFKSVQASVQADPNPLPADRRLLEDAPVSRIVYAPRTASAGARLAGEDSGARPSPDLSAPVAGRGGRGPRGAGAVPVTPGRRFCGPDRADGSDGESGYFGRSGISGPGPSGATTACAGGFGGAGMVRLARAGGTGALLSPRNGRPRARGASGASPPAGARPSRDVRDPGTAFMGSHAVDPVVRGSGDVDLRVPSHPSRPASNTGDPAAG